MATVTKIPVITTNSTPGPTHEQLRRDRITASVVLGLMIVGMAAVIWLASITGNEVPDTELWHLMP